MRGRSGMGPAGSGLRRRKSHRKEDRPSPLPRAGLLSRGWQLGLGSLAPNHHWRPQQNLLRLASRCGCPLNLKKVPERYSLATCEACLDLPKQDSNPVRGPAFDLIGLSPTRLQDLGKFSGRFRTMCLDRLQAFYSAWKLFQLAKSAVWRLL